MAAGYENLAGFWPGPDMICGATLVILAALFVTVHCVGGGAEAAGKATDVEKGSRSRKEAGPPCDEIIQIYRRDSHEEVYCGSHTYPGRGVYLLKFDNSYSLWRSKTVYYRVYYSK